MKSISKSRCDSLIISATLTTLVLVATTFVFGLQSVNSKNNHQNDNQPLISTNTKHKQQQQQQHLSNEYLNLIEADENGLYLVGLFDIHQSNPRTPFKCGKIDVDSGESQSKRPMQNMEAFLWAIEQVNLDKNLLPGIKLGSLVMNTCSSFLRTNQQMANLLHGQLTSKFGQQVPNLRQIMAIIADNSDYPSIEAVSSMASALGITTFVTQSRSSKLSELARKYTMTSALSGQNQAILSNATPLTTSANLANQDNAILRMLSLQAPPLQPPIEDSLNLQDYSGQQESSSVQKRSLAASPLSSFQSTHNSVMSAAEQKRFEGMLSELFGIGKMTTPTSSNVEESNVDNMMPMTSGLSEAFLALNSSTTSTSGDSSSSSYNIDDIETRQQKLLMVKMLLGNELLADALASLISAMQWDFVNIIYDDELDMIDLHDELLRLLYNRNIQLAFDEQIAFGSASDTYDKLLQNLAKKSTYGARVVITLLGTGSSRSLLDSLHHFRSSSQELNSRIEQINQVNSLIWITVSDREPYYSFATDALGTLTVSSAVSLIPEFKTYYDRLVSEEHASINRWWPEYMKAILVKHQKDIELISNECSKWIEPRLSPLQERCRSLTLTSLVQYEKSAAASNHLLLLSNNTKSSINGNINNNTKPTVSYNSSKLSKYLANGWDHNGMDVINSVLAAANGLESIRQALCPDQAIGICARMRDLVQPSASAATAATTTIQQQFNNNNNKPQVSSNNESANSSNNNKSNFQIDNLPMLSELIYNEMSRSTFQLADGRMFNLDDDFNSNSLGQVEGKLKLYNLRYLQANSIGFVKFGSFDRQDGLLMNSSKALHYTNNNNYLSQVPIENVKSTCQDESKCLMLSSYESALNKQETVAGFSVGHSTTTNRGISEEELASGVNSLFKLDHPFILSPQSSNNHHHHHHHVSNGGDASSINQSQTGNSIELQEQDSHIQTIQAFPSFVSGAHFSWNSSSFGSTEEHQQQQHFNNIKTFNVIVLLPLHRRNQSSSFVESSKMPSLKCSEQMDIEHSFQHLVALSYAQKELANSQQEWLTNSNNNNNNNNNRNGQLLVEPQIELTTTVIDYCEQSELASLKLAAKLKEGAVNGGRSNNNNNNKFVGDSVAVIDFDSQISKNIAKLVAQNGLLHLSIGSEKLQSVEDRKETLERSGKSNEESTTSSTSSQSTNTHLRVSLLPSKLNEIQAIVKLISAMNQWKLVHLIYTDHHHYRDEFVRRANEANICVSKLIWIPTLDGTKNSTTKTGDGGGGGNRNNVLEREKEQMVDEVELQKTLHLEKIKQLFSRELHDYSSNSFSPSKSQTPSHKIFSLGQNSLHKSNEELFDDELGLNNTRVLVVLASENDSTNQMILEAASKSMLDDYIWVTSHEWLNSVELSRELHQHQQHQQQKATLIESPPTTTTTTTTTTNYNKQQQQLPKYFVSTKLETFESNDFKRYFSNLSPSIHSPVPTNWFDQFWQQNFQCKLPISNSIVAPATNLAGAPVCKSNERLDLHNIIEDDKVHYTILALESLHAALEAAQNLSIDTKSKEFASIFKLTFDKSRNQPPSSRLFVDDNNDNNNNNNLLNNKFAKLPYGFHIVHRLLPSSTTPPIVEDEINGKRRQNSRSLSHDSHQQQQLLKVGLWRDGQLILLKKFNNNSTYNHLLWLNNNHANSGESDGQDDTNNQIEIGFAISKSLQRLASIQSKCSPKNGKMCKLCHKQIEQTLNQIKQEEIRLLQSQSVNEPKAISSILLDLSGKGNKQQSIFDIVSNSNFDDSDNNQDGEEAEQMDDKSSRDSILNKKINSDSNDDIQISASSLFDLNTQKQVEQQRRIDIQRSYNHLIHSNREQAANRWNNMRSIQPSMNLSGILMSLLSVMGIVCVVSSMAYFYPNMLERKDKPDSLKTTTTTAGCGSFYTNSQQQERKLEGVDSSSSSNSISANSSLTQSSIDNINDYFLLTGLLMLYSINIAFLLPATLNVCWFRRIGLASSYTMVFSSILVKILSNYRQCWRQKLNIEKLQSSSSSLLNSQQQQQVMMRTHYQQVMDPVEENVEVTFESLPPEQTNSSNVATVQSSEFCSTVDQLSNAYQTTNQQNSSSDNQQSQYSHNFRDQLPWITCKNSTLLTILIGLILGQSIISIIWLVKQPPEPTLLYSCWRCASPSRSPILFLYEPLIGLLYPALILLFGWFWAISSFRLALNNEEKYRLNTRRLLLNNPLISNNQRLNINYQNLLENKLRDAKSLVITATLLVLTWSLSTLNMISSSQKLLSSLSLSGGFFSSSSSSLSTTTNSDVSSLSTTTTTTRHQTINQTELFSKTEDFTLVYSNIISGVVIFTFLFIYRLHLFRSFKCNKSKIGCCCFISPYRKSIRSRCLIIRSSSGAQQFLTSEQRNQRLGQFHSQTGQTVLKFNGSTSDMTLQGTNNKWLDYDNDTYPVSSFGDSLFTGSQFSASSSSSRRERLRLQQFNTYGTYSSSSTANNNSNNGINNSSDINPLALQALASSFVANSKRAKSSKVRQQTSGLFDTNSSFEKSKNNSNDNKSLKKRNKSPSLFFGHSTSSSSIQKSSKTTGNENNKLQRRQSANSVASSTAKLVTKDNNSMIYNNDMFDTLSCASSVASSSTSQLHGNDLYPIDCSIQPEV